MWKLIIILACVIFKVITGENIPIKLYITKKNTTYYDCIASEVPKLSEEDKFTVNVISTEQIKEIQRFQKCDLANPKYNITEFENKKGGENGHYTFNNLDPKSFPQNDLSCTFCMETISKNKCTENNCYEFDNFKKCRGVECKFQFISHSETAISSIYVKNGKEIITTESGNPSDRYGSATYSYYDGEPAFITCSRNSNYQKQLSLRFKTNLNITDAISLDDFEPADSIEFYVKLTKKYNGKYIECESSNYDGTLHTINRLNFNMVQIQQGNLGFIVNKVKFLIRDPPNSPINFAYQYYDGEKIKISVVNYGTHADPKCNFDGIIGTGVVAGSFDFINDITLSIYFTKEGLGFTLTCYMESLVVNINFMSNQKLLSYYDPVISDFPMANVIAKYITTNNQPYNVIRYYPGETLHFNCISYNEITEWMVDPDNKNKTLIKNTDGGSKIYKFSMTLPTTNMTHFSVICRTDAKTSKVRLIASNSAVVTDEDVFKSKEESPTDTIRNDQNSFVNEPEGTSTPIDKQYLIIAACIAPAVIIIIGCIFFIYRRRNKLQTENINPTQINYNTLNEDANATLRQTNEIENYATPSDLQENCYSLPYTPKTVAELYATPIPKQLRENESSSNSVANEPYSYAAIAPKAIRHLGISNHEILKARSKITGKNKSPYTEVSYYKNESPYAEVSNKSESSYAEVSNKSESSYAEGSNKSESPYAEVSNKSESPYAEIPNQRHSQYAEISFPKTKNKAIPKKENPYAKIAYPVAKIRDPDRYCNVFDSERYVNSNSPKPDYAEPAYCEMNKN